MILFKENGRFGNQIFQYCGLRTLAKPEETLCLFGFEDLQSVFTGIDAEIINQHAKKYKRSIYYRLYSYAEKLAERNVVPVISENNQRNIYITPGKFNQLMIAREIFLQSEIFFDKSIANRLSIKQHLLDESNRKLDSLTKPSHQPIFVHVRRGDFLSWPDSNNPAVLPTSFYFDSINEVKKSIENPFFIFTSDEPHYVKNEFKEIEPKYISEHSVKIDFAIMSLCKGGILSPSSLSWWAAYFVNKINTNAILIGPEFWGGHRIAKWYPKKIQASFICYRGCQIR